MQNDIIRDKIRGTIKVLSKLCKLSSQPVEMIYVAVDEYKKDNNPPSVNAGWKTTSKSLKQRAEMLK